MAERSNAAVLKTVVPQGTGGSNPSLSAKIHKIFLMDFLINIIVNNFLEMKHSYSIILSVTADFCR